MCRSLRPRPPFRRREASTVLVSPKDPSLERTERELQDVFKTFTYDGTSANNSPWPIITYRYNSYPLPFSCLRSSKSAVSAPARPSVLIVNRTFFNVRDSNHEPRTAGAVFVQHRATVAQYDHVERGDTEKAMQTQQRQPV